MAYTKQTWQYESSGGTPISADRLNVMEQGIFDAAEDADAAVAASNDAVNKANTALPKASIQSGNVTVNVAAANTPTSIQVTFATTFAVVPQVVVTATTTVPGTQVTGVAVTGTTTTGCLLWITATTTGNRGMNWIAVAP